jgi:hypothetical protein
MSSTIDPQREPSANDELVAYLDGELAPDECRRVEDRLAADDDYRQQLRDLDQAWEALNALPTTAVDDGFARTTIELACVAAEEDLSKRTAQATAENRGRKRWWIAAGVAAAVMGFVMMRALAVHRNNILLADLPVIEQVNALALVTDVDFLRRLSSADFVNKVVKDDPEFKRTLADFTSANSASLGERRQWVNSLSAEQKAELAVRSRAFEELPKNFQSKDRLRQLANDIGRAPDAAALQKTLVAYGQWLSRHSAGEQQTLREKFQGLSADQQVAEIQKFVDRDNRHLSPEERTKLRSEIFALANDKKAGPVRDRIEKMDVANVGPALFVVGESIQNNETREATINRLLGSLSRDTNEHWKKLPRWQRERQWSQLSEWLHEAIQTKEGPGDLERFFASDKLTNDQRQMLLDKPKSEMEAELKRLYLKSDLGIDERWQLFREFGERGRGPRNEPPGSGPPQGGRPGPGPQRRPDGPPPNPPFGPDGQPRKQFDPDRPPGPRGPRPEDRPNGGRQGNRPPRPPGDRPDGPPPGEPKPPAENPQPI